MKITEETKIKDFIPEGYELDENTNNETEFRGFEKGWMNVPIKKKEVKDFGWYVGEYMNSIFINFKYKVHGHISDAFRSENYDKISFEIKIGLLKFICDDCGVKWWNLTKHYAIKEDLSKSFYQKVIYICPDEFLNSIFK